MHIYGVLHTGTPAVCTHIKTPFGLVSFTHDVPAKSGSPTRFDTDAKEMSEISQPGVKARTKRSNRAATCIRGNPDNSISLTKTP